LSSHSVAVTPLPSLLLCLTEGAAITSERPQGLSPFGNREAVQDMVSPAPLGLQLLFCQEHWSLHWEGKEPWRAMPVCLGTDVMSQPRRGHLLCGSRGLLAELVPQLLSPSLSVNGLGCWALPVWLPVSPSFSILTPSSGSMFHSLLKPQMWKCLGALWVQGTLTRGDHSGLLAGNTGAQGGIASKGLGKG
jgi:hypothetical protein